MRRTLLLTIFWSWWMTFWPWWRTVGRWGGNSKKTAKRPGHRGGECRPDFKGKAQEAVFMLVWAAEQLIKYPVTLGAFCSQNFKERGGIVLAAVTVTGTIDFLEGVAPVVHRRSK